MLHLIALAVLLSQTPLNGPAGTPYKMTWVYDCVNWPVPKYFEWGEYGNGHYTKWDRTTVQSCRGASWQFIVTSKTPYAVTTRTKYYVRAQSSTGVYGPAIYTVGGI
jgi:hypothetical protein